jgi:transcriptional regulator with XRE-family HTH domain
MNNLSKIGLRLKLARELCELTQQQIADKTATPQANYARYESGVTKKVPHSFLHKVAKILCVDFE